VEQKVAGETYKYSDISIALAVILMVVMMVIPLPTFALDLLLTFNLTFALVIMLVSMYTLRPLDFSIFPSLLLVTTLFRLSLNVSSTRLILLQHNAGEIIKRFGEFVVGGNAVVGFIVFLILVVIQFVVITKGAERVAEVAARFTLDAMPGKQMSIDADLNAGLITEDQARSRRLEIEQEADFYGAMDGASKFVKGDAIAGIVITIINLLGGFVVGVAQEGMELAEAVSTYSLLTVGDGLVTQIPALLISTATGIVVTRAASDTNLGEDLVRQIVRQPRVLYIAAAVLVLFGVVPGLPRVPFFVLGALMAYLAISVQRAATKRDEDILVAQQEAAAAHKQAAGPEEVLPLLRVDPLEVELGYALLPLTEGEQQGDLATRVSLIRRQVALELGLIVPAIRIVDNLQLDPNRYIVKLRGAEVGSGEILANHHLAMDPGTASDELDGIRTTEPAFGLPAWWVSGAAKDEAEMKGYTVVDPASVLATHLTELVKAHAHEILSRQLVKMLVNTVKEDNPAVVEEVIGDQMTLGDIQKVLQNLLWERVSIRDMLTILETLADYAHVTKDPHLLTEYVRQALSRQIMKQHGFDQGPKPVITLDPGLEQRILDSIEHTEEGPYLRLDPDTIEATISSLKVQIEKAVGRGVEPVVLCAPVVRMYFKKLVSRSAPDLVVLSYNELDSRSEVEAIGTVTT